MALSALTAQLRSKGVKISLKPNYKTYYTHYPHIIRFTYKSNRNDWHAARSLQRHVTSDLLKLLEIEDFRTRSEYYNFNVYCKDLETALKAININRLKEWESVEVGEMAEEVLEESSVKPELPRAQTSVVKRLPYNQWRYRVHWSPSYRLTDKIGKEALSAIVDQINSDPNTRHLDDRTSERLKRGTYWGTSYFYTNSEDVLCLITLITPLFIKKIEKFTTVEELNEKRTG